MSGSVNHWKFDIGTTVKLTGTYLDDKQSQGKPYQGIVIGRSIDKTRSTETYKHYVYTVDGVGVYGEPALTT